MQFDNIHNIKKYILSLKNSCHEESKWYADLVWFSSNNYTTTSEYFGELMLLVQQLIVDEEMKEHRYELIQLESVLRSYFKQLF